MGDHGWIPLRPEPASQQTGPARLRRSVGVAVSVGLVVVLAGTMALGMMNSSLASRSPASSPPALELTEAQLKPGICLTGSNMGLNTGRAWPYQVAAVPCTKPHLAEVFFAGNIWPKSLTAYPGDKAVINQGGTRCDAAFTAYNGIDANTSRFSYTYVIPYAGEWASGARLLVCIAYEPYNLGVAAVRYSIKGSRK